MHSERYFLSVLLSFTTLFPPVFSSSPLNEGGEMEVRILLIPYIHDLWGYSEHFEGINHQKQSYRNPHNIATYLHLRFLFLILLQ